MEVAQRVSRPLGLHCLLYLLADRVCRPVSHYWGGSLTESLRTSEHRLARAAGSVIEVSVRGLLRFLGEDISKTRVSVPCRPTVEVLQIDLESRLLMAALFECRDRGRVELRLGEPSRRRLLGSGGRVQVRLLPGPALGGLCGEILKQFPRRGEQGPTGC